MEKLCTFPKAVYATVTKFDTSPRATEISGCRSWFGVCKAAEEGNSEMD